MRLPVLNHPPDTVLSRSRCGDRDNCSPCKLYVKNGGRCEGCSPQHQAILLDNYKACYKECTSCGGLFTDVDALSICCRSPLRDIYMQQMAGDDWNAPHYTVHERPLITLKSRAVFYVTAGSVGTIVRSDGYLVPPDTEAVAVSLARVWSGKRFASRDMHDYLKIPSRTKLMLMTMNRDDILESFFASDIYTDASNFERVGFTWWMPITFSAYRQDAHMQQYFNYLRTMHCTEHSRAWWFTGNFRRSGLRLDDLFDAAIAKLPQIVFNTQFLANADITKKALADVAWFHRRSPANVAFWFIGAATPTFFANVRKLTGTRRLYWVSGNPHHFAAQGKEFDERGTGRKSPLPKSELVTANITSFTRLVNAYG